MVSSWSESPRALLARSYSVEGDEQDVQALAAYQNGNSLQANNPEILQRLIVVLEKLVAACSP